MEKYFMAAMGGANGLGNKSIETLVKVFGSAKAAWFAEVVDLMKSGIRKKSLGAFLEFRAKYPDAPKNISGYCERHKIGLCSIFDEDYPPLLKQIDSPPMIFYYRGKLQPDAQRIAVVGSRENTAYGQSVALELGEDLASAGVTVVSGAAKGIDTFAHRGALRVGRTVAVLGCGINFVFPRENKELLEQIAERGVVLSEFPPQMPPNHGTFPTRNRIIAGLSRGVIIVEAGTKSGALITSSYAGRYGRDVFAIPGQIYASQSMGCNELIRDGAILIKSARDVINEYEIAAQEKISGSDKTSGNDKISVDDKISADKPPRSEIILDDDEAKVFEIIPRDKFITEDEIIYRLEDVNPYELSEIMLNLELKGCVEGDAGRYKRKVGG